MYWTNFSPSPSARRCSRVTGSGAVVKPASLADAAGQIMVEDGGATGQHEVRALIHAAMRLGSAEDLPGHAQPHRAAIQLREAGEQSPPAKGIVLRLLEAIPQRHVQEVDASRRAEFPGEIANLPQGETVALRREAQPQEEVGAAPFPDSVDDLPDEARAVLRAAAVLVVATVRVRIQELAENVAVRAVDLHAVEAGRLGAPCRRDEVVAQPMHLVVRQRPRSELLVLGGTERRLPDQRLRGAHAGVVQLQNRDAVVLVEAGGQTREPFPVIVREAAELTGEAPPRGLDVGRAGHRRAEAAGRAHRQPAMLVVGERAVVVTLLVRHRGQHEAVLHRGAGREREAGEQVGHGTPLRMSP